MNSIWPEQHERTIHLIFQIEDAIDLDAIPDTDHYRWDVAKPAVDAVVDALTDHCFQILDDPYHSWNSEMEVWEFHILFHGWRCSLEIHYEVERRNNVRFCLQARFDWTDFRALVLPSRFKNNLAALSSALVAALNQGKRIKKIIHIRP